MNGWLLTGIVVALVVSTAAVAFLVGYRRGWDDSGAEIEEETDAH